jgi:26S proteasome regulatory subunit (ATPase 3-interacting protein)
MDSRAQELREESTTMNETLKNLRAAYAKINSTLSTADLRESVAVLESERVHILERLALLRSGTVQPVSKEDKDKVDKEFKTWNKTTTNRRRIVKELWGTLADTCPGPTEVAAMRVSECGPFFEGYSVCC